MVKIVKTITIVDNEDGSEYVYINNIDGKGVNVEIKRGKTNFTCREENDTTCYGYPIKEVEFNLQISCYPNNNKEYYNIKRPMAISDYSDSELLDELKNRNVILEKTVYEINI